MNDCRPDFYRATNAAYAVLLSSDSLIPPYPVIEIARRVPNCVAMTYYHACRKYGLGLPLLFADSDHGMTLKLGQQSIILYSEYRSRETARFTIAHELGHVVLGHKEDNEAADKEANCFARNLLCPALVSKALSLRSAFAYSEVFNISMAAATTSLNMIKADLFNLSPSTRGAFMIKYRECQTQTIQAQILA